MCFHITQRKQAEFPVQVINDPQLSLTRGRFNIPRANPNRTSTFRHCDTFPVYFFNFTSPHCVLRGDTAEGLRRPETRSCLTLQRQGGENVAGRPPALQREPYMSPPKARLSHYNGSLLHCTLKKRKRRAMDESSAACLLEAR